MNKPKHTPGPWDVGPFKDCVAIKKRQSILFERPHGGIGLDNFEANARLIAAAPELLEACKTMLDFYSRIYPADRSAAGVGFMVSNLIEKAIAKAEWKE